LRLWRTIFFCAFFLRSQFTLQPRRQPERITSFDLHDFFERDSQGPFIY
jgi:hypothetical protein